MIFMVILGVIIAILAILFAFQNATVIAISLGAWQFEESLAIVLLITLGLGIIISLLLSIPTIIKRGWINSRQKNKIVDLEEQVNYKKQEWENSVNRAISKRLANGISPDSFLGVTNKQHFICLTLGLTGQQTAEYSESLIEQLTASPLQKADGTTLALKVNLGGAIADPADQIDSHGFLQQAEQNLEKAREQKRSSAVITEIVTKPDSLPE